MNLGMGDGCYEWNCPFDTFIRKLVECMLMHQLSVWRIIFSQESSIESELVLGRDGVHEDWVMGTEEEDATDAQRRREDEGKTNPGSLS